MRYLLIVAMLMVEGIGGTSMAENTVFNIKIHHQEQGGITLNGVDNITITNAVKRGFLSLRQAR